MARRCAHPCCGEEAARTLAYDYGSATVWLDQLSDEGHPMTHDLCQLHAERLSVPRGWTLQDRCGTVLSLFSREPSGRAAVTA